MPISTFSRSRPKKKTFRKKNPTKTVKEWELTQLRRQVKRMMPKPEWKYSDATVEATITSAGNVTNLTPLVRGTSDVTRIGDKIQLKNLFVRLSVTPNATAGMNYLRHIVVLDKQPNGVAPTIAQVLTGANYNAMRNIEFGKRFVVLHDKTYTVDNDATGSQVDKVYRKLRIFSEYDANNTDCNTNGLYAIQISDQATNGPAVAIRYRTRYTDC